MDKYHFISYSAVDGFDVALRLCDELQSGPPSIAAWFDRRELHAGADWDKQIVEAIHDCESLIFVMTRDSVEDASVCKNEWVQALKYKKPIVLVRFHAGAEPPFRLNSRQYVDFAHDFATGLARLRKDLLNLSSPHGLLWAIAAYRAARAINSDAGVVKRTLRLLDALMVADNDGLLAEVRNAAAGSATG